MNEKTTLVIGASDNKSRYSYLAVKKLKAYQHPVIAYGNKAGQIDDEPIVTTLPQNKTIDTVTLYIGPQHQPAYYDYLIQLHPKRIIFNPGTENETLKKLAQANGISTMEACTLVMLSTGQY